MFASLVNTDYLSARYLEPRAIRSVGNNHEPDVHVGYSLCTLCRQAATLELHVLDMNQKLHAVPDCGSECKWCIASPYPAVWVHPTCYSVLRWSYEPAEMPTFEALRRFADATRPTYRCLPEEHREGRSVREGLFSEYTREIFQDGFTQEFLGRLPAELLCDITELVAPCWYLTVLGETRRLIQCLRETSGIHTQKMRLKSEMWVSIIQYRGTDYVAQLSDEPLDSTSASGQYQIRLPDKTSKIVLSVDCIGIRGIQFVDCNSSPTSDGSPWYEILDVRHSDLEVYVKSDGLFMRSIQLDSSCPPTYRAWSSPIPPEFHPWNVDRDSLLLQSRLDYFKIDSHIRGILVCCAITKNVGIHGFSGPSKAYRQFLDLMNRRLSDIHKYWMYFPLNKDEIIKAAWIRKARFSEVAINPILILQTSLGRTVTFGTPVPARNAHMYEYHPLVKDGDGAISGIFHNVDPALGYVFEFGVTCNGQHQVGPVEPSPLPRFKPPADSPGQGLAVCTWYMTDAPLQGLVRVQVCRNTEEPHRPCLGLLLYYHDGQMESIGQVRWDWDLSQELWTPIYVQAGVVDGYEYIKNFRSGEPSTGSDAERNGWQKIPEHGTVVWWSTGWLDRITIYAD